MAERLPDTHSRLSGLVGARSKRLILFDTCNSVNNSSAKPALEIYRPDTHERCNDPLAFCHPRGVYDVVFRTAHVADSSLECVRKNNVLDGTGFYAVFLSQLFYLSAADQFSQLDVSPVSYTHLTLPTICSV